MKKKLKKNDQMMYLIMINMQSKNDQIMFVNIDMQSKYCYCVFIVSVILQWLFGNFVRGHTCTYKNSIKWTKGVTF